MTHLAQTFDCNSLQFTAAHCNTLQHTATHLVQTFDKILILCSASLNKNHNKKKRPILTFETTYLEPFGRAVIEFWACSRDLRRGDMRWEAEYVMSRNHFAIIIF